MKTQAKYKEDRKAVASFMRRLYTQRLTTTSGGNISKMVSGDLIAITPSATDKGRMRWKEVGLLTTGGENLTPELKPSIESEMHLAIYRKTGARAIVHAHPVFATSFTAMKRKIEVNLTAEACAILGEPLVVPYALMGSVNLAEIVADYAGRSSILLLENHGILATGADLLQAFDRIEVLENAARMTVITSIMGRRSSLSISQVSEIKRIFG
jgi:L-fuculose-phosphate aldolase